MTIMAILSTGIVCRPECRRLSRSPSLDDHGHTEPGPQRDQRPWIRQVSRRDVKTVRLRESRDDQLRLNQRKLVADALARSCAERDIRELWTIRAALECKTLGIEPL